MPGVVSLPHGWGHDRPGTRMAVAREHAGVNNNLLAPGALLSTRCRATPRSTASPSRSSPPDRSGVSIAPGCAAAYDARNLRARSVDQGDTMKKLLIILILAAIGIAVAKKVREA